LLLLLHFSQKVIKTLAKMEHHAQSVDDALIGGLSYKLKPGASYVTNRRSVSFMASGGNQYSPSGVKVIRFNLTADQWLDPSTFRVMFQLNQKQGLLHFVKPLHWNPAVFFRRARLIAGGQVIEDIDDFNRLSLMLTALKPQEEQLDIANDGFGNFDVFEEYSTEDADERKTYREGDFNESGQVINFRRVLFKPMFGLFNQDKLLPLRYCPLQIELELVNNGADSVFTGTKNAITFTANWDITDVQCKCDLLTLDSSLENEYASHLLSGKTLPINFSSWNHTNQATNQDKDFSAHISRALTRLKSVCITLHRSDEDWYKVCNNFYHPMGASTAEQGYQSEGEHQVWIQIGSMLMPEYPVNSVTEAYYQLKKVVGRAFNIHSRWYRSRRYIIGFDLEKIAGAGFTGLSTKNGDLLTVNFRNCMNGTEANSQPARMYCALNYDAILNIRDQGIELLD
jgi:hypothetical protein